MRECFDTGGIDALTPLQGIQAVLEGRLRSYIQEYPCDSPDTKRWFLTRVTPFEATDITSRKLAELSQQIAHH